MKFIIPYRKTAEKSLNNEVPNLLTDKLQ